MPRHVDPDDDSFRRSLLRAAAGGVAAMVVTFGIVAVLTVVGRDDGQGGPAVVFTDGPTAAAPASSEVAALPEAQPQTEAVRDPRPKPTRPEPTATPQEVVEDAEDDGTVQVLYGFGLQDQAGEAAAVLRDLGYIVVAVNSTSHVVESTTVFATPGHTDLAERLLEEDARFGAIDENTVFSPDVELHVVVGAEFAP